MKHLLTIAMMTFPFTPVVAEECHWADGSYHGEDGNFMARFTVNADCTEIEFRSSGNLGIQEQDVPQTFPLVAGERGWVADINGVEATLAKKGSFINFIGKGVNTRLQIQPTK